MEKIIYTTRVFIKGSTSHVMIRVRWNRKQEEAAVTLKSRAEQSKWDVTRQRAKSSTTHCFGSETYSAKSINTEITDTLEAIDDLFVEFGLNAEIPTRALFKEALANKLNRSKTEEKSMAFTLDELYERFMNSAGDERNWTKKVHCKYQQMWQQIHACDKHLTLETLTKEKMVQIKNCYVKNGYSNVTTNKQFRIFKSFLRWMCEQGYELNPGVLEFKTGLKTIPKTVTYLTYEELMAFYRFELPKEKLYLERARDLFCFMAFTSLRISDLIHLRYSNIVGDNLILTTQKTSDKLCIPLIDQAKELIDKYKDSEYEGGTLFPVISDQKMNDYLKEAAELAGLDRVVIQEQYFGTIRKSVEYKFYEQISCHDARKTFVCCSLAFGIPVPTVMACTGHSTYEAMKPYIDVANATQRTELAKWNKRDERSDLKAALDEATDEQLEAIRKILRL